MATLAVDIDELKSEKALNATIEAFDLSYDIDYSDEIVETNDGGYSPDLWLQLKKPGRITQTVKV